MTDEVADVLHEVIPVAGLTDVQIATRLTLEAARYPTSEIKTLALESARRIIGGCTRVQPDLDAYRAGAEAMREAAATLVEENVETMLPGRLVRRPEHENTRGMSYAAALRALPLPEQGGGNG